MLFLPNKCSFIQMEIISRVSRPMISPIPKSVHFLDYLNFGALLDFFIWSIYYNLCNLELVICLLIQNLQNLYKSTFFQWSNHGTKGVDHWATYPKCDGPIDKTKYVLFSNNKNINLSIIKIGNNKINETSVNKFQAFISTKNLIL